MRVGINVHKYIKLNYIRLNFITHIPDIKNNWTQSYGTVIIIIIDYLISNSIDANEYWIFKDHFVRQNRQLRVGCHSSNNSSDSHPTVGKVTFTNYVSLI